MNENEKEVTPREKESVLKVMAIIGFLAVVVIGIIFAVQAVRYVPGAFASLASLAESVYNGATPTESTETESVSLTTSTDLVSTNESVTLDFDTAQAGTYTITVPCTDGVSVQIVNPDTDDVSVACDEPYQVTTSPLEVQISSERSRFTDVPFILTYTPESGDPVTAEQVVTVLNASIPVAGADEDTGTEEDVAEDASEETEDVAETPTDTTPEVVEVPVVTFPVSDPNGDIDLAVTFRGVGVIENNQFVRTGTVDNDEQAAFQFTVENIGTKTSEDWDFTATFTSNTDYESQTQDPLKPGEFATLTIGFDNVGEPGIQSFGTTVTTDNDVNDANNSFTWAVEVVE